MLGSTAKTLADSTANSAVVAAIAAICADQFQRSADSANNLTTLKKTSSYEQAAFVEKGWATMPGSKAVDIGVPQACAAILSNLK
jgi:predicted dinucleotide-binding enzyme